MRFTKPGAARDADAAEKVRAFVAAEKIDELIVISHGFNHTVLDVTELYREVFASVGAQLASAPKLSGRRVGVLAVLWPTLKIHILESAGQAGRRAVAENADDPVDAAKELFLVLGDEVGDEWKAKLKEIALATSRSTDSWPEFLTTLRKVVPEADKSMDDDDLLLLESLKAIGKADEAAALAAMENEKFGAEFITVKQRVASSMRGLTFLKMKQRAAQVGKNGVAACVENIRADRPGLRLHFVGHSLGARLVTAAAMELGGDAQSAPDSMTLLQAAFSSNSFSKDVPTNWLFKDTEGAFSGMMDKACVRGPVLVTHSWNDKAVRLGYKLARELQSIVIGEKPTVETLEANVYAGIGATGVLRMADGLVEDVSLLEAGDGGYEFGKGKLYNLKSDEFVKNHTDVKGPQIAYAIVKAMEATL